MFIRKLNIQTENIETPRLILKQISEEHENDIFEIYYDYDVIRFTDSNLHFNKDDSAKFIKKINELNQQEKAIYWGLYEKKENKIIGTIGLYNIDHKHFFSSISVLLNKKYWRQGYMFEALKSIIPYAFDTIQLHRIEAQMYIHHEASINLFEKLRFTREAMLRENFQIEWKQENSYLYSMLKSEYQSRKEFFR